MKNQYFKSYTINFIHHTIAKRKLKKNKWNSDRKNIYKSETNRKNVTRRQNALLFISAHPADGRGQVHSNAIIENRTSSRAMIASIPHYTTIRENTRLHTAYGYFAFAKRENVHSTGNNGSLEVVFVVRDPHWGFETLQMLMRACLIFEIWVYPENLICGVSFDLVLNLFCNGTACARFFANH